VVVAQAHGTSQLVLLGLWLQRKGFAFWSLGHCYSPQLEYKRALGHRILVRYFTIRTEAVTEIPLRFYCFYLRFLSAPRRRKTAPLELRAAAAPLPRALSQRRRRRRRP
jgi:hypothetical protein